MSNIIITNISNCNEITTEVTNEGHKILEENKFFNGLNTVMQNEEFRSFYNKYFKDYKDVTVTPEVKVPKTMEEYKKMLLENKIERIKQKKRISEIKSTRLFFTTNTGQNGNINSSRNNLKNMSFT